MANDLESPVKEIINEGFTEIPPHRGELQRIVRVFIGRKLALIGLVIIVAIFLTAIFAPWLAPYDPYKMSLSEKLAQPSSQHWLGTDSLGRDTLSRIIYGTRTSLAVGMGAVGLAVIIGELLGIIAAYFGGIVFAIIMRFTDALMATPMILNALVISVLLGGGLRNVIIALSVGMGIQSVPDDVRSNTDD